jgi:hypothetical protein
MQIPFKLILIWLVLGVGIIGPLISVSHTSPHYGVASHIYRVSLFHPGPTPPTVDSGLTQPAQPALESVRYGLGFGLQSGLHLLLFGSLTGLSFKLTHLSRYQFPAPLKIYSVDLPPPEKPPPYLARPYFS